MPILETAGLRHYQFDLLSGCDLIQGIYTRSGGVSPQPWASLNLGGTVGDERTNVIENRKRIFDRVGRPVASIFDVWQVHGTTVICSRIPRPLDGAHQPADAILTDHPDITLFMRFADCVPIFLHDPIRKVVGIVHAGWKGTVAKICASAVQTMVREYSSSPENILAGIGPSISVQSYQVGADVIQQVQSAFNGNSSQLLEDRAGSTYFDLWKANQLVLEESHLRSDHIQIAGICTAQNVTDWFSHRAENGKTGRFGALLALK